MRTGSGIAAPVMQGAAADFGGAGALAFIVAAAVCFSAGDATVKAIGSTVPVVILVWARYAFQAITMAAWQGWRLRAGMFRTRRLPLQIVRGLVLVGNTCAAYAGLQYLPIAEYTTLTMTTPIIVLLVCGLLGQVVTRAQWGLVVLGFASILVILRPGTALLVPAVALPLAVASTQAAFQLLTARLSGLDDPCTTHFWTGLIGCVALSAVVPVVLPPLPAVLDTLSMRQWLSLGAIGLVASAGHLMLIFALARAPVPVLMPATYVQIPIAALVGWLVFGHTPDLWTAVGMAIVALVGIVAVWAAARARAG